MMKLDIPYIPSLDPNDIETAINTLDNEGTRCTVESLNWGDEFPYMPLTTFSVAHNGKYIFIDFFVRCNYLRAVNSTNNSKVCEDSCVEFFVDPKGDGHYWNFEFNCIGAVSASHRTERHNPTRLTDEELGQIVRYASCGTRPFREVEGLFAWNLAIAIPLSLIGIEYDGKPVKMKANFNKCASGTSQPHFLSWAPIATEHPDFHHPEFFGEITLM